MPEPMRTKPVSGAQVRAYAGKAEEYAHAAASGIEAGRYIEPGESEARLA